VTAGASPDEDPGLIERLDAGEPARSPEEAAARAPYERLLARIRDLDDIAPPGDWEDETVARWSRARRRRRLGVVLGGAAAAGAALAAVLLLRPCAAPTPTGLEVTVLDPSGSIRRGDAAVGQLLRARASADQAYVELRVYLGTRRVARCPGDPACRRDGSVLELDWKLVEAGTYQVILLSSLSDIPAGQGTLEGDVLDARDSGASTETRSFTVTP